MTAPTIDRDRTDSGEPRPGPAQVLAALAEFSAPETLAMIDKQIDEAYRTGLDQGSPEPLHRVLDHWWLVVRVQRGEVEPPFEPMTREKLKAQWEAANPGQKLPA